MHTSYDLLTVKIQDLIQNSTEMANWCCNNVTFTGKKENLHALLKVLQEMEKRAFAQQMGVIPIMQKEEPDGYFFNIDITDENINEESEVDDLFIQMRYESRWSPNPRALQWIGVKFAVDFEYEYEESGNKIYGKYKFTYTDNEEDPIFQHKDLTDEEWDSCLYLESPDGTESKSHGEITEVEWDQLTDEDWNQCEDYEKLNDTLDDKEWGSVN